MILETDKDNKQTASNLYGTELVSRKVNSKNETFMYNGHGDVTGLTDETGNVDQTYYYDAFGVVEEETGSFDNPYTYSGYQYDDESGLYYLNSRYYDPDLARFLTEDTYRGDILEPLSLNLYTYCHNDPVMASDPSGHWPKWMKSAAKAVKKVAAKAVKKAVKVVKAVAKAVKKVVYAVAKKVYDGANRIKKQIIAVKNFFKTAIQVGKAAVAYQVQKKFAPYYTSATKTYLTAAII